MSNRSSDAVSQFRRAEQAVNRLERNLALEKIKKRKADTRRKIELGGLVIKAGMDQYPKDVILGVLISGFKEMKQGLELERLYSQKGASAFCWLK